MRKRTFDEMKSDLGSKEIPFSATVISANILDAELNKAEATLQLLRSQESKIQVEMKKAMANLEAKWQKKLALAIIEREKGEQLLGKFVNGAFKMKDKPPEPVCSRTAKGRPRGNDSLIPERNTSLETGPATNASNGLGNGQLFEPKNTTANEPMKDTSVTKIAES